MSFAWKHKLDIKKDWALAKEDKITVQVLAGVIANRLSKIDFGDEDANYESECLVEQFEEISRDETADRNEFDSLMSDLYDFADVDKRLWVSTLI